MIPTSWLAVGKPLAAIAASIAVYLAVNSFIDGQRKIGYDKAISERTADLIAAKEESDKLRDKLQDEKDAAELERTNHEKEIATLRNRASAIAGKLRDTEHALNSYIDGSSIETCRTTAKTAIQLFGACVERYRDVAEAAAGHLADVELFERSFPTGRAVAITGP